MASSATYQKDTDTSHLPPGGPDRPANQRGERTVPSRSHAPLLWQQGEEITAPLGRYFYRGEIDQSSDRLWTWRDTLLLHELVGDVTRLSDHHLHSAVLDVSEWLRSRFLRIIEALTDSTSTLYVRKNQSCAVLFIHLDLDTSVSGARLRSAGGAQSATKRVELSELLYANTEVSVSCVSSTNSQWDLFHCFVFLFFWFLQEVNQSLYGFRSVGSSSLMNTFMIFFRSKIWSPEVKSYATLVTTLKTTINYTALTSFVE